MQKDNRGGFTLVEVLLAVFILAGTISGVLLLFSTSMMHSELAWDTTVATSHGEHILEEMQARDSLSAILALNWKDWIKSQGLNTLPGESIDIVFTDQETDLLDVQVNVNWVRKERESLITLNTKFTK